MDIGKILIVRMNFSCGDALFLILKGMRELQMSFF
jgi:hypothetical protein